jgi:hypothetical protein
MFDSPGASHRRYPHEAIKPEDVIAYVEGAHPRLSGSGGPLNHTTNRKAYCKGDSRLVAFPAWDNLAAGAPEAALEAQRTEWLRQGVLVNDWRTLTAFRTCLAALQERFDAAIGRGVPAAPPAPS